jgi:hypothetical protein
MRPTIKTALAVLRMKTAAEASGTPIRDAVSSARRGVGHVWDAVNKGAQTTAEHLASKGAPKIVSGAIHAAPVAGALYGGYKVLQGASDWNRDRILRSQMGG